MLKKIICALSVLVLFNSSSCAFAMNGEEVSDKFLKEFLSGDSQKAVTDYMETKIVGLIGAQVTATIAQVDAYMKTFGGYEGHQVLHRETLSDRLKRNVYIVHTSSVPVSFEVFTYKTNLGWKVSSFRFDTDMKIIFPAMKGE